MVGPIQFDVSADDLDDGTASTLSRSTDVTQRESAGGHTAIPNYFNGLEKQSSTNLTKLNKSAVEPRP